MILASFRKIKAIPNYNIFFLIDETLNNLQVAQISALLISVA